MKENTTIYINAGGRGTRLNPLFTPSKETGITKSLLAFSGTPLIDMHVQLFRELGFKKIIVSAGDHYSVNDHFQSSALHSPYLGSELEVINQEIQYDTAGDLLQIVKNRLINTPYVLVENVDTLLSCDILKFLSHHKNKELNATIALTSKKGVPNEGAFSMDIDDLVMQNNEGNDVNKPLPLGAQWNGSSTGAVVFNTEFLEQYPWNSGDGSLSIYRDLLPELIEEKNLSGYSNGKDFFIDVGTPESYLKIKRREGSFFGALRKRILSYSNSSPK